MEVTGGVAAFFDLAPGGYLFGTFAMAILVLLISPFFKLRNYTTETVFGIAIAIMMVIYAGGCVVFAVLGVHEPVRVRIALIIFAILQAPIAALRFGSTMNVEQEFALIMGSKFVAQLLAVQIAHITSGWLEALFFA